MKTALTFVAGAAVTVALFLCTQFGQAASVCALLEFTK